MAQLIFLSTLWSNSAEGTLLYHVKKLEGNNSAYLILNNVAKPLTDDSIVPLGFSPEALEIITLSDLEKLKIGDAVPSLRYHDQTADELTRIEILKSRAINGDLIYEAKDVGNYINPAIVKWQGRLLFATGLSWGFAGSKHKPPTNTLEFRWLNDSRYPYYTDTPYLGIDNEIAELSSMIIGQDPRIVVLEDPDRFQVYYTNQFEKIARMGMAEVMVNRTTNSVQVVKYFFTIHPTMDWKSPQKNWTPFVYRNEVLLIQSINPFVVVKTAPNDAGHLVSYHESTSPAEDIHWTYGELRGGTNAIFLKEINAYFAFFHSAGHVPGNNMKTYVLGAYTFSADAPFRLLSMSPYAIMPGQFYNGPWHPMKQRMIDYCLFPLAIFVDKDDLVLSAGFQDSRGYLLRMKLQHVLDTLVPVGSHPKRRRRV